MNWWWHFKKKTKRPVFKVTYKAPYWHLLVKHHDSRDWFFVELSRDKDALREHIEEYRAMELLGDEIFN